jgi:DnaK suppressor protein
MTDAPRARLLARRAELERQTATGADAAQPVELDQSRVGRLSRMDTMQQQAMAQESQRRRETALKRIDAALARVDAGDYGYCVTCDEPIAEKRLAVDPAAPLCVACAGKRERG